MEYIDVTTPIGQMQLVPTDARHIFIATKSGSFSVTINRVNYHVNAHFYRWNTGEWNLGAQFTKDGTVRSSYDRSQDLYLSRSGSHDYSFSAKKKAEETLTAFVREWAKNNPKELEKAEVEHLTKQVEKLDSEIEELQQQLQEKLKQQTSVSELLEAKKTVLGL